MILSSAFDSNKALNNLNSGDIVQTASSAIHLGTEIPLTRGLLNLRKKAFTAEGRANELIPEKEYVIVLEPQVLKMPVFPAQA